MGKLYEYIEGTVPALELIEAIVKHQGPGTVLFCLAFILSKRGELSFMKGEKEEAKKDIELAKEIESLANRNTY